MTYERMLELAEAHHVEVWQERISEIECLCGTYTMPRESALVNGTPHCPSCGDDIDKDDVTHTDRIGFWYWTCLPGCLPDSDVSGPYDNAVDALKDATEGLEDES
jgi:hypothetical protein